MAFSKLVSVYIPTKNRLDLLKRAVCSVLIQNYKNIELIVVNDGSTDGTGAYLKELEKSQENVRVIHNESSKGACFCRNLAIKQANGYFVTGLDDDDFFLQNRIDEFVKCWGDGSYAKALYSSHSVILKAGFIKSIHRKDNPSRNEHFLGNKIGNQVFSTKDNYIEAGLFDVNLPIFQDFEFWLRFLRLGPIRRVNNFSYVFDHTHESLRISNSKSDIVKSTVNYIIKKHDLNFKQRLRIKAFSQNYIFDTAVIEYLILALITIELKTVSRLLHLIAKRSVLSFRG